MIDVFEGFMRSEFRTKASKQPAELMKVKLKELKERQERIKKGK